MKRTFHKGKLLHLLRPIETFTTFTYEVSQLIITVNNADRAAIKRHPKYHKLRKYSFEFLSPKDARCINKAAYHEHNGFLPRTITSLSYSYCHVQFKFTSIDDFYDILEEYIFNYYSARNEISCSSFYIDVYPAYTFDFVKYLLDNNKRVAILFTTPKNEECKKFIKKYSNIQQYRCREYVVYENTLDEVTQLTGKKITSFPAMLMKTFENMEMFCAKTADELWDMIKEIKDPLNMEKIKSRQNDIKKGRKSVVMFKEIIEAHKNDENRT